MEDLPDEIKVKIYQRIIDRHRESIEATEKKTIMDLKLMVKPYEEFIKQLRERFISGEYTYEENFLEVVEKAIEYVGGIKNITLPVQFWLGFKEMDELKVGEVTDKAMLFVSLLRSLGSPNAKVLISKSKRAYVQFEWKGDTYLVNIETASTLRGNDVDEETKKEKIVYAFNDLFFESYEEE